jgi:hypothetical protein
MKASFELRKELRKLPELLIGEEEVLNLAGGEHAGKRGLLAVTNRRVIFLDEGLSRHSLDDYPYTQITSVESGTRRVRGHVVIYTAGKKASIKDVYPKERAVEIGDYIRPQIGRVTAAATQAPMPAARVASASPSADVYEQLEKLGQLRDGGVLTPEEFAAKKADLLTRL